MRLQLMIFPILKMATLIKSSKNPTPIGHGVIISNATEEILALAETLQAPIVTKTRKRYYSRKSSASTWYARHAWNSICK